MPVKKICAWCNPPKFLGHVPPYESDAETHGFCPECAEKWRREQLKQGGKRMAFVARDMDGELAIFGKMPVRQRIAWWTPGIRKALTWWKPGCGWADPFPEIKWESDPVEVNILIEKAD